MADQLDLLNQLAKKAVDACASKGKGKGEQLDLLSWKPRPKARPPRGAHGEQLDLLSYRARFTAKPSLPPPVTPPPPPSSSTAPSTPSEWRYEPKVGDHVVAFYGSSTTHGTIIGENPKSWVVRIEDPTGTYSGQLCVNKWSTFTGPRSGVMSLADSSLVGWLKRYPPPAHRAPVAPPPLAPVPVPTPAPIAKPSPAPASDRFRSGNEAKLAFKKALDTLGFVPNARAKDSYELPGAERLYRIEFRKTSLRLEHLTGADPRTGKGGTWSGATNEIYYGKLVIAGKARCARLAAAYRDLILKEKERHEGKVSSLPPPPELPPLGEHRGHVPVTQADLAWIRVGTVLASYSPSHNMFIENEKVTNVGASFIMACHHYTKTGHDFKTGKLYEVPAVGKLHRYNWDGRGFQTGGSYLYKKAT